MPNITAITTQKKSPNRYSIFVDGKFELGVAGSLVLRYNLKVGDELTPVLKKELEEDDRIELAYNGLLNFIAYRERCENEVREWLFKKGYRDLQDELIARLKERDYLNDERFARLYVRDRVKLKAWGPVRLRHELMSKRISKPIIENTLLAIQDDVDFDQIAADLTRQRLRSIPKPTYRDKKRLWAFLQRRGYTTSSISKALAGFVFIKESES